jgi:hypothetical protein
MQSARAVTRAARLACAAGFAVAFAAPVWSQTIEDGVMMGKGQLFTGVVYSHDTWDEYWEGGLKRDNGNIGTLETQSNTVFANYGITDRLNVIGHVPYVWTQASQGVLAGMSGVQDLTLAAKFRAIHAPDTALGTISAFAVLSAGIPLTDYAFDFQPLSIGMGSTRITPRGTLTLQGETSGLFMDTTGAYTWRSDVTLDRPYYFTDDELHMTDNVVMPQVFDVGLSGGYRRNGRMAAALFEWQHMTSGGDIRRQDAPFVSNRMNATRIGAMGMYPIPKLEALAVNGSYAYTVSGRNVGQSSTVTFGLSYQFGIWGRPKP